uniref:Uncharacterized protein n=1 Tax=Pristionchus pacificus TaxID=54126 RepID=A0A2A6B3T8_PRIPA
MDKKRMRSAVNEVKSRVDRSRASTPKGKSKTTNRTKMVANTIVIIVNMQRRRRRKISGKGREIGRELSISKKELTESAASKPEPRERHYEK